MANSLGGAANQNNQMISLINPFTNQQHQLDDVNLFTGNCKKCRSCFVNLPESQNQACVAIDSSHRQTFFTLTGVELSSTPKSVDFLCLDCAIMLKVFSEMGQAAAEMQNRYIEFMQNQIDVVKVEPEQSEDPEPDSDDEPQIVFSDGEEIEQIFQEILSLFENNDVDNEMESPGDAAVENMRDCSVELTKFSSETIKQCSSDETLQRSCNEFRCPIDGCNKTFKSKNSLYQHRYNVHKRHSQDKSRCNQCGKVYKNKTALRNHQRMHNRKLECDICGKSFAQKYYLIDHMETYHIDNSRNKCQKCSNTFKSQRKLKLHQRNTHDVKKSKCDKCDAAFTAPCRLTDHVKVKHEGKSFLCSYPGCSTNSTTPSNTFKHLREVHKLIGDEYKKHCNQIKIC